MPEGDVAVFVIQGGQSLRDEWLRYDHVERAEVIGPKDLTDLAGLRERSCLLDLTAATDIRTLDIGVIQNYLEGGGIALGVPWGGTAIDGLFTVANLSAGRLLPFTPAMYHPALLELRRILDGEILGASAGISIVCSPVYPRRRFYYALSSLFGVPAGYRPGKSDFLWFGHRGCEVVWNAAAAEGFLSIRVACKRGTVIAEMGRKSMVRVLPAGGDAYRLPLPDGDGIYYNRKVATEAVSGQIPLSIFPPSVAEQAFRWAQESVHEGT
jgi:hypothetical protein